MGGRGESQTQHNWHTDGTQAEVAGQGHEVPAMYSRTYLNAKTYIIFHIFGLLVQQLNASSFIRIYL